MRNYQPASCQVLEPIERGTAKRFPLQLEAGKTYAIVGACGADCDHVQLALLDPAGAQLVASPERRPVVVIAGTTTAAGSYALELAAPGCRKPVCQAGFVIARHEPGPKPAPSPAPPSTSREAGTFLAHVASDRSRDGALATYATLKELAPAALARSEAVVQQADLGAKGVWHRLWIGPPMSEARARALCDALKTAGHPYCRALSAGASGRDAEANAPGASQERAGIFDGTWTLTWRAEGCELPDGATAGSYAMTVSAGAVAGLNGRLRGKVSAAGKAAWTVTAKADGVVVRYAGTFGAANGTGRFSRADGSCQGTFTAQRRT